MIECRYCGSTENICLEHKVCQECEFKDLTGVAND